jgi:hypothetical protein
MEARVVNRKVTVYRRAALVASAPIVFPAAAIVAASFGAWSEFGELCAAWRQAWTVPFEPQRPELASPRRHACHKCSYVLFCDAEREASCEKWEEQ